jgi:hypothetical protein
MSVASPSTSDRKSLGRRIYVCHSHHENDSVYAENIAEYCSDVGVDCRSIQADDQSTLFDILVGNPDSVIGFNSQLDHAWLGDEPFLAAAEKRGVPVIQWILDHPSCRWPAFRISNGANSTYVFNSRYSEAYFRRFCLPISVTSCAAGVGPNKRSRLAQLQLDAFLDRQYSCLIPLNLARVGGPIAQLQNCLGALEPRHYGALVEAFMLARHDLIQPIEVHLASVLSALSISLSTLEFHRYVQMVEEKVQTFRRLHIFQVARNYPVLIQSDSTARSYAAGGIASFSEDIGMKLTLSRMPQARAVLSASHLNDMIHDRTLNGLNAGCVNIVEDSLAHRAYFKQGVNALFFRYDDDSLRECLDLVCYRPRAVYPIAENGFALRDLQPFRFGGYHHLVRPRAQVMRDIAQIAIPAKSVHRSIKEVIQVSKSITIGLRTPVQRSLS